MRQHVLTMCLVAILCLSACESPPQPMELPTPRPGTGVVHGVLRSAKDGKPLVDQVVLLARILPGTEGTMSIASLDGKASPQAITDSGGRFMILDVPPDKYALAMMMPMGYVLLLRPETGKEIMVTVNPNSVSEVSEVSVSDPVLK